MESPVEENNFNGVENNVDKTNEEHLCHIEASVPTGFETTAKSEVFEKLNVSANTTRGRIFFKINEDLLEQVLLLKSIDHLYVVLHEEKHFGFEEENHKTKLGDLVKTIDWSKGLEVWRRITKSKFTLQEIMNREKFESDNPEHNTKPAFRVTCNRVGNSHKFTSMEAARVFGGEINDYFNWKCDLKNFDIEVVLNIDEQKVYVSVSVTKESLHKRNLHSFGPTTLRATICYNMLRLCNIQPGDIVCDPMCGGGSISIEGAINWPKAVHMCGDIHQLARDRTLENIKALNEERQAKNEPLLSIDVFQWDITKLPLGDNSVDIFITDLPFGERMGSTISNRDLYVSLLKQMARVVKVGTGKACLLTKDKTSIFKSLKKVNAWHLNTTISVNIGGMSCYVYLLYRNSKQSW